MARSGCYSNETRICPGFTASVGATSTDFTIPDVSALILISIFIASRTSSRSFSFTRSLGFTCTRTTTPASGLRHSLDSSIREEDPGFGAVGSTEEWIAADTDVGNSISVDRSASATSTSNVLPPTTIVSFNDYPRQACSICGSHKRLNIPFVSVPLLYGVVRTLNDVTPVLLPTP